MNESRENVSVSAGRGKIARREVVERALWGNLGHVDVSVNLYEFIDGETPPAKRVMACNLTSTWLAPPLASTH